MFLCSIYLSIHPYPETETSVQSIDVWDIQRKAMAFHGIHTVLGELLSGSDDCSICLWDINQTSTTNVPALNTWKGHGDVVEDVAWHAYSPHLFSSVGDDRQILMWDTRKKGSADPFIRVIDAHRADIHSINSIRITSLYWQLAQPMNV